MDSELGQYLNTIVILLSLIAGLLATELLVSAESMSATFLLIPVVIGIGIGGFAWPVAGAIERKYRDRYPKEERVS